jgi:hypothetical protein
MNAKQKSVLERIKHSEEAIARGQEYLETGAHAKWYGFRPLFVTKTKHGTELPPHQDWVRNVFIPYHKRALKRAEKALERLSNT